MRSVFVAHIVGMHAPRFPESHGRSPSGPSAHVHVARERGSAHSTRANISAARPPSPSVALRAVLFWWRDACPPKPIASARWMSAWHSPVLNTSSITCKAWTRVD
eukprot:6015965-Prymnesium_polylepis.1